VRRLPPVGLELAPNSPENSTNPAPRGAKSGALDRKEPAFDPALAALIDAWTTLPQVIKAAITALIHASSV